MIWSNHRRKKKLLVSAKITNTCPSIMAAISRQGVRKKKGMAFSDPHKGHSAQL